MKRAATLIYLFLLLLAGTASAQGVWTTMAPMPTARHHLASAVYNEKIYVFGGFGAPGNSPLTVNEMYDPATNTWASKSPMPSPVGFCNAAAVNGKIYVIGGWDGGYQTNQNWEYDPGNNSWAVKATMPTIRSDAATAVVNGKIYAIGGWQYGSNPRAENEMYDPATNSWTVKAPMPSARGYLTVAAVNNKIYAIGGGDAVNYILQVQEYDPSTNTWAIKSTMPCIKAGLASVVINNEIYLFGGSTNPADTTLIYTPATDTWRIAPNLPTHRVFLAASQVNNNAYVFGGSLTGGLDYLAVNERFGPGSALSISASSNPVCAGDPVSFTANGFTSTPGSTLQWFLNGTLIPGANSATYSFIPQQGDQLYSVFAAPGPPAVSDTSNVILMTVNPLPANLGQSASVSSLQNGLFAHYPLDGNAGDLSGHNLNGTPSNVSFTPGHLAQCANFQGSGDSYINLGTWNFPDTLTVSMFIKRAHYTYSPYNAQEILTKYDDISGNFRTFYFNLPAPSCALRTAIHPDGSAQYLTDGTTPLTEGQWYHIVATYNGSNQARIYLNGVLEAENNTLPSTGLYNSSVPVYLGRDHKDWGTIYGQYFGAIDEVRIYNRVLTPCEIAALNNPSTACDLLAVSLANNVICPGEATAISLFHSETGISYQVLKNGVPFGAPQTGNGGTLVFPVTGLAQTSSFTITAAGSLPGCSIVLDTTLTVTMGTINAVVSPNTSICSGSNCTLTASGGTGYLWSNAMTTPSITVSPLVTTTYYVTVTNGGCTDTDSVKVTVNPVPSPVVSGPATVCKGAVNVVYSTQTGMSNYTWAISAGGMIVSGAGTSTITVQWNVQGAQSVSVNYANSFACTAPGPTVFNVSVNPMPAPVITGSTGMCVSSGYYDYTTQPGMNNYQWSVSPGGTVVWGTGTDHLIVTWDVPGAQWVKVNYTNPSGCTAVNPSQLDVTVQPLPGPAGTITGTATVCAGMNGVAYSTQMIAHAVTYVWNLPPGATIASGAGTNAITVNFSPVAVPGEITVYGNNLCGNGTLSPQLSLNVGALPGNAGTPAGEEVVCQGDTGVIYYVSPIPGASGYIWEITGGGVITAGNGTNQIHAKFPARPTTCQVTVYGQNSCGQGVISPPRIVTVHLLPPVPVITQNGSELISSAPAGNQWYLNGTLIPGATSQTLTPSQSGNYTVIVTLDGCSSGASAPVFFVMTGVEAMNFIHLSVFPNPTTGLITLQCRSCSGADLLKVRVRNLYGEALGAPVTGDGTTRQVDLSSFPPGMYLLQVVTELGREMVKIIRQ